MIWNFLRKIVKFLIPSKKSLSWKVSPAVWWTIHVILVILVLVGVYFLGRYWRLDQAIPLPPFIANIWFPLLIFLIYILLWIVWWLWKVWNIDEEREEFPDIEQAWDEAMRALSKAGISIKDVPLFFVLGRPESGAENLFEAAQLELTVKQTPDDKDAPLHVFANRDAVFVCAATTSLLGNLASILALEDLQNWPAFADTYEGPSGETVTLMPGETEQRSLSPGGEDDVIAEGRPGSALERRSKRRLLNLSIPNLLKSTDFLEETASRLQFLCSLIVRDRQPFCPVNGVLLLVPFGATDSDEEARQAAGLIERDLNTLRDSFRMCCPLFALVCDLETTWGFYEFLGRQKPDSKLRRLGQRFPLSSDVELSAKRDFLGKSVDWMGNQVVREWVFHLFQVNKDPDEEEEVVQGNTRLYRLLDMMHERSPHLGRILKQSVLPSGDVPGDNQEPWFYGGCYLAATGANKNTEQAFVRGVLDRLIDTQEYVCWTDRCVQEDAANRSQAMTGYAILGVIWLLLILLVVWRMWWR